MGQRQCLIDGVRVLKPSREVESELRLHLCMHVCNNPVTECYRVSKWQCLPESAYDRNAWPFCSPTLKLQLQLDFTTD